MSSYRRNVAFGFTYERSGLATQKEREEELKEARRRQSARARQVQEVGR